MARMGDVCPDQKALNALLTLTVQNGSIGFVEAHHHLHRMMMMHLDRYLMCDKDQSVYRSGVLGVHDCQFTLRICLATSGGDRDPMRTREEKVGSVQSDRI